MQLNALALAALWLGVSLGGWAETASKPNGFEQAFSITMALPALSIIYTSDLSSDEKQIKWSQAQEEACLFIASEGAIRGVFFEQALSQVRGRGAAQGRALSDLQWAAMIASAQ